MEVAEEDKQQIAKRATIQAIMRDPSLNPQEKQQKIQQFMASGAAQQPAPAPSPPAPAAPSPPPSSDNGAATPANSRQAKMSNIMRDPSLTPQEKQKRIQEIMAGGVSPEPEQAPEPEASSAVSGVAPPASSKQALMQSVMNDPNLTPVEKQQKIQGILKGGVASPAPAQTTAPNSTEMIREVMRDTSLTPQERQQKVQQIMSKASPPAAVAAAAAPPPAAPGDDAFTASRPSVGAVASSGPDPASRKGGRASAPITNNLAGSGAPASTARPSTASAPTGAVASSGGDPAARKTGRASAPITASAATVPVANPPRVGAMSSTSSDPAARKGARTSSMRGSVDGTTDSSAEPAAMPMPTLGAVTSSGIDPASRKTARGSSTPSSGASVASSTVGHSSVAGASVASRASDPAARKTGRSSHAGSTRTMVSSIWGKSDVPTFYSHQLQWTTLLLKRCRDPLVVEVMEHRFQHQFPVFRRTRLPWPRAEA